MCAQISLLRAHTLRCRVLRTFGDNRLTQGFLWVYHNSKIYLKFSAPRSLFENITPLKVCAEKLLLTLWFGKRVVYAQENMFL